MKKKYSAQACVCVTRQALIFYTPNVPDLQSITLTTEVLADLEVINQPALERILKNWLRKNQIVPEKIIVFFVGDTYFFQDVTQVPTSVEDPAVLEFAHTVPFTNVVTKIFPTQNGARVLVINRDLLVPIMAALENCGFTVVAAAPSFAAGISKENPFTKEVAMSAMKNEDVFLLYNFIENDELERKLEADTSFLSVQFDKKLIGMFVFFIVLVMILITLLIAQNG